MENREFVVANLPKLLQVFDNKTVLLAGPTGVVGTAYLNFFRLLLDFGVQVRIDCISYSGKILVDYANHKEFNFFRGDVVNSIFTGSLAEYDVVIHAAGYGQPAKFTTDPMGALRTNTLGTFNLAEKLKQGGKFVYFSSSEVYAGLEGKNFSECQIGTTSPNHPRAAYIEGKRVGETIVNTYRSMHDVQAYIFRLALAHGPGADMSDERVLNSFVKMALMSGVIEMKDQGKAIRTYCSSQDAINLTMSTLINGHEGTFNLGGVSRVTIRELAEKIASMIGAQVIMPIKDDQYLKDAPSEVSLDLEKILSSCPDYTFDALEDALSTTIDWFKTISKPITQIYTTI
jgi:UDP-glucuronate decarboxylase